MNQGSRLENDLHQSTSVSFQLRFRQSSVFPGNKGPASNGLKSGGSQSIRCGCHRVHSGGGRDEHGNSVKRSLLKVVSVQPDGWQKNIFKRKDNLRASLMGDYIVLWQGSHRALSMPEYSPISRLPNEKHFLSWSFDFSTRQLSWWSLTLVEYGPEPKIRYYLALRMKSIAYTKSGKQPDKIRITSKQKGIQYQ